ncbi:MAG: hypothetical protein OEZ32_03750 [Nitrospinota bacterium]|nr:hypothetical protein [Nitrospinota bacterium]
MKPSEFYSTNEKLQFSLSEDVGAEKYVCLVKKFKESLMAVVVANSDKDKITLSRGDQIFLHKPENGGTNITPFKLVQNQTFPLIILDMVTPPEDDETLKGTIPGPVMEEIPTTEDEPDQEPATSVEAIPDSEELVATEEVLEETSVAEEEHPPPYVPEALEAAAGTEEDIVPMVEMDIPDEEEEEETESYLPEEAEEEESEEDIVPMVEMDIPDEEEEEETESYLPEEAEEEESEEDIVPMVEMDIPDEDEESFEGMRGVIQEVEQIENSKEVLDLEDEDAMSGYMFQPLDDSTTKAELDAMEDTEQSENMESTPLMETVGSEYENTDDISDMAISDDYLDYQPIGPPSAIEEVDFEYQDSESIDSLDETLQDSYILPGALEEQSVNYMGTEDITRMETEQEMLGDETPEAGFFLPEPLEEEPDLASEEPLPDVDLELETEESEEEELSFEEEDAEPAQEMMHEEDLEATSTDISDDTISEEDIDILDKELLGLPDMDEKDLDMAISGPSAPPEDEEDEDYEEEEEDIPGYPQVDDFHDMEMTTSRDFNIMDLDLLTQPHQEEDGDVDPIRIKEEGHNYAFDDIEDTVKILAPYSEEDDTLSGFMLDDLEAGQDPITLSQSDRPDYDIDHEESDAMLEVSIPEDGHDDESPIDSFGSTARIPKSEARGMVAQRGVFEDYFGFRFSEVSPGMFPSLTQMILETPTTQRRQASPSTQGGEQVELGDSVGKDVKNAITRLMEKVNTLEKQLGQAPGLGAPSQATPAGFTPTGEEPRGICVSINSSGLVAAIEGHAPAQGLPVFISIDRPWEPPLRVDAMAEMTSSEIKGGAVNICYFRFTAINQKDKDAIDLYVARASDIFDRIQRALRS